MRSLGEDTISLESGYPSLEEILPQALQQLKIPRQITGATERGWSRMKLLQTCPYLYAATYKGLLGEDGGKRERKPAAEVGTLFHAMTALYYNPKKPLDRKLADRLFDIVCLKGADPEVTGESQRLFNAYVERYREDYLRPLAAEWDGVDQQGNTCRFDLVAEVADDQPECPAGVYAIEHKCVPGSTELFDIDEGRISTVEDIFARGGRFQTLAWSGSKVVKANATASAQRVRSCYRVKTKSGRLVDCSSNHPLLTKRGWVPAANIRETDCLAVAQMTLPGAKATQDELSFLGYMLGDGYMPRLSFSKGDREVVDDFEKVCTRLGERPYRFKARGLERVDLSQVGPAASLVDRWGLRESRSVSKFIPPELRIASRDQVYQLIGALWSTDGCIDLCEERRGDRTYTKPRVIYTSRSERLASNVRDLLWSIGVYATLRTSTVNYKGRRRRYWTVAVRSRESLLKFLRLAQEGTIPIKRSSVSLSTVINDLLNKSGGGPSSTLERDRDLFWDPVDSVMVTGRELMFDISVPGPENFVLPSGLITHNTRSRFDASALNWENDGEILGQINAGMSESFEKKFGVPLSGVIVNIIGRQKEIRFLRLVIPVQEDHRQHVSDLKVWRAVEAMYESTGVWPRARAACVGPYGPCQLYRHCAGEK